MSESKAESEVVFSRIALVCSAITAVLGILVMTGWITGVRSLVSLGSNSIPMAPSTALAFILLGGTLFLYASRRSGRMYVLVSALFVLLVAILNLIRFFTGLDAGIEEFLLRRVLALEPGIYGAGPMSPLTAANFILICTAVVLLLSPLRDAAGLSAGLASIATSVNFVILLAYLYGTPLLYGGNIRPVSLPSGVTFIFLGAGLIAAAGPDHFPLRLLVGPSVRALLLRYFLLVIFVFALAHAIIYNLLSRLIINEGLRDTLSILISAAITGVAIFQLSQIIGGAMDRADAERKRAEEKLQRTAHDLGERIKELTCLYAISNLEKQDIPLEDMLKRIVELIPPAYQYPEITCARIIFEDKEFRTDNFKETIWKQKSDIVVNGEYTGYLEVCYLEERPESDEGPFLKEERDLINAITERLGKTIERKRTEAELYLFRYLIDQSNDALYIIDPGTGSILDVNDRACYTLGYTREELLNLKVKEVDAVIPDDPSWQKHVAEVKERGSLILEGKHKRKDGTLFPVEVNVRYIAMDGNEYMVAVARDITERKKMELAIQESEKKYRGLYDSIKDGIALTDLSGRILECNQAYLDMLGYTQEEIRGVTYQQLTPVKWHEMEARIVEQQILKRGYSDEYEKEYIKKVGTVFPVSLKIWLIKNEQGEPVGMWGIVRDITERKHAEERLQHRIDMEKLIASISTRFINLPPDEIDSAINHTLQTIGEFAGVDRSYMFLFYDGGTKMDNTHEWCAEGIEPQIQNLKGLPVDDFPWLSERLRKFKTIYIPSVEDLPPEAHAETEHFQMQHIKSLLVVPMVSGTSLIGFLGFDSVKTKKTWLEEDVRLLKMVGEIFINALKRKQVEEELRRSNAELEQFAYVASHDLQEPLRMISGFIQLLERRYKDKLGKDASEFIAYIVDGARRMQRMVEDLLAYSRVGTRGKPFKPTDLNSVFDQAVTNLKVTIEENRAVITHDPLPTVMADDSQMIQLFQNLIGNGIKFRKREELPRIHVSAQKKGEEWIFSVRDNGIGISPEFMGRLFQIFQREHPASPGTGIGLAICKKIVERHGGRIWAESEPGKGSMFCFTMPARRMEEQR